MSSRYSNKLKLRACTLYREGNPISQILRRRGMPTDHKTIRRWLREANISVRVNERRFPRKAILEALQSQSRAEVAEKYGCSAKFLSNLVRGKISL